MKIYAANDACMLYSNITYHVKASFIFTVFGLYGQSYCVVPSTGYCAFVDAEHALDPALAKVIGVKTENLLLSQPDSGEQALSLVDTLIRSGSIDVVVVDSVSHATPTTSFILS